tara:strand:+ start:392 stop:742 length:351 start_codon:yes stop_codon:yes gene_type:complete
MSLDISLYMDVDTGGNTPERFDLFSASYTHNARDMASEAGIYTHIWRPEDLIDFHCAGDLIEGLRDGVRLMEYDPARFIAVQPENGWGSYDSFLPWVREYLSACIKHPKALIETDR